MTTLADIRTKVRRLTASPSANQISDDDIDMYINTFYLHDLPQHLKLFDLKETYTFPTEPNIDTYELNVNPSFTDDEVRSYYSVERPVYIAGYEVFYTQSRSEFYRLYPSINSRQSTAGTGIAGPYAITITDTPVLRNNVTVSAVDVGGNSLSATDDGAGGFTGDIAAGVIDYVTGEITALVFNGAIAATENIETQSVAYVENRPNAVLFYDNTFTLRPVPDIAYRVEMDAYIYPTVLLNDGSTPEIQCMWQLLAAGASKKIFEDRGDMEGIQTLMPLYQEQMLLVQRRTLAQHRPERAATIYSAQTSTYGNLNQNRY